MNKFIKNKRVVYITNIPVHYKENIHQKIFKSLDKKYLVIYCNKLEPDRIWKNKFGKYNKIFLNSSPIKYGNSYTYFNFTIINKLRSYNPDILIINGNSMPMILAFVWGKIFRKKLISTSDTNILVEKKLNLTFLQILLRKLIYPRFDAYIGTSKKTIKLYKKYGAKNNFFVSPLSVDYKSQKKTKKIFDIILCGRFVKGKLFEFSIEVLKKVNKYKKIRLKVVGYGPLKDKILNKLKESKINYVFKGPVQPKKIINEFKSSKIFLFPTLLDAWGIVANEACISKTVVITCKNAGCAHELIIDNYNGYVLKLNANLWSKNIKLLNNKKKLSKFSKNSLKKVKFFNSKNSSEKILNAISSTI